jgi:methylphosphotriester-DNA--protein-cysteine methyltransferase
MRRGAITLAGHRRGRIYGRLDCPSGRRMRREQRVFFADEAEALALGYRPCGRCLPLAYHAWRSEGGRDRRV